MAVGLVLDTPTVCRIVQHVCHHVPGGHAGSNWPAPLGRHDACSVDDVGGFLELDAALCNAATGGCVCGNRGLAGHITRWYAGSHTAAASAWEDAGRINDVAPALELNATLARSGRRGGNIGGDPLETWQVVGDISSGNALPDGSAALRRQSAGNVDDVAAVQELHLPVSWMVLGLLVDVTCRHTVSRAPGSTRRHHAGGGNHHVALLKLDTPTLLWARVTVRGRSIGIGDVPCRNSKSHIVAAPWREHARRVQDFAPALKLDALLTRRLRRRRSGPQGHGDSHRSASCGGDCIVRDKACWDTVPGGPAASRGQHTRRVDDVVVPSELDPPASLGSGSRRGHKSVDRILGRHDALAIDDTTALLELDASPTRGTIAFAPVASSGHLDLRVRVGRNKACGLTRPHRARPLGRYHTGGVCNVKVLVETNALAVRSCCALGGGGSASPRGSASG
mmetsp:Transcript_83355/g.232436  ORF Transcript_83355/g.232436 Transcript_83355/m.232436 type:complete len:451 (+) Transcript_83355:1659-3011(+)